MLSIGDVPPIRRTPEGAVICNVEHHADDCGTSSPRHLGTTPSSSATTLTTASGWGMPAAEGKPPRMTARLMTLGTFRCPSSFDDGDPFSAKTTRTISSMLNDFRLDITLWIHERISEFRSLWHYPSSLRNRCDGRTRLVERKKKKR